MDRVEILISKKLLEGTYMFKDYYNTVPVFFNLEEAKAIGTMKDKGMSSRDLALAMDRLPPKYRKIQKSRMSAASKFEKIISAKLHQGLMMEMEKYFDEEIDIEELKMKTTDMFIEAYEKVFDRVVDSVKVHTLDGPGDIASKEERKWLKSAIDEELIYWYKFLDDINRGRVSKNNVSRRIGAYVDTVRSVYDSARVVLTPVMTVIYWVKRNDNKVCESCQYLAARSPYTKEKIPTAPRSGLTKCYSSCRCRLLIKQVDWDEYEKIDAALPQKASMLKRLKDIKAGRFSK